MKFNFYAFNVANKIKNRTCPLFLILVLFLNPYSNNNQHTDKQFLTN